MSLIGASIATPIALERPLTVAAAASYPPVTVYVGYADNTRASGFFPNPWQGSTATNFVGGGTTYDSGAIRITNPSGTAITVGDISIDIGSTHFDLWGSNLNLAANGNLVVAQTSSTNFDTSDIGTSNCTKTGFVPAIHVTINGITTTYTDSRQVVNTGGFDLANCPVGTNESSAAYISHLWPANTNTGARTLTISVLRQTS